MSDDDNADSLVPSRKRRRSVGSSSMGGSTGAAPPQTAGGEDDLVELADLQARKTSKPPRQQPIASFVVPSSLAADFKHEWCTAAAVAGLTTIQVGLGVGPWCRLGAMAAMPFSPCAYAPLPSPTLAPDRAPCV